MKNWIQNMQNTLSILHHRINTLIRVYLGSQIRYLFSQTLRKQSTFGPLKPITDRAFTWSWWRPAIWRSWPGCSRHRNWTKIYWTKIHPTSCWLWTKQISSCLVCKDKKLDLPHSNTKHRINKLNWPAGALAWTIIISFSFTLQAASVLETSVSGLPS